IIRGSRRLGIPLNDDSHLGQAAIRNWAVASRSYGTLPSCRAWEADHPADESEHPVDSTNRRPFGETRCVLSAGRADVSGFQGRTVCPPQAARFLSHGNAVSEKAAVVRLNRARLR